MLTDQRVYPAYGSDDNVCFELLVDQHEPKNDRQAHDLMLDLAHQRDVYDRDPTGGQPSRY